MKALEDLSDDEVLREAGNLGPGVIGQAMFDRAQWIRKNNPKGTLGPALTGSFGQSAAEHERANTQQAATLEKELARLETEETDPEEDPPEEYDAEDENYAPDFSTPATKTPTQEAKEKAREERIAKKAATKGPRKK